MPSFTTQRPVPFTAEQMYALVADVETYPEFLPLCERLTVTRREQQGDTEILDAAMGIGYLTFRETFSTRVTLRPADNAIDVTYLDGPFSILDNRWRFIPSDTGSTVDFFINYEFKSVMLGLLMGAMFDTAFRRFAEAFEDRARVVYGSPQGGAQNPAA